MATGMTDAEVFGGQARKPSAGMTDEEVFGKPAAAPPAPPPSAAPPTSAGAVDEYARPIGSATFNPGPDISTPIRNALAPAPNTTYGSVVPLAKDNTTGEIRLALPEMLRAPLIGLTQEGPQITDGKLQVPGATINPDTGTLGITPEAASVSQFAASPLRIGPMGPVPNALAAREAPLTSEFRAAPMAPAAKAKIADTPAGAPISGLPASVPEPPPAERGGSVGAAQSVNPPEMTPDEFKASRYDGELRRAMEDPKPGDATIYVPGVTPTKAEIELTPKASLEAKGLRQEFREGFSAKEKEDNRVYYDTFDDIAGTKTQVQRLERERSAQAEKDLKDAGLTLESERPPVDAQAVVDKIDEILAHPRTGESGDVIRYLKPIRDQMFDANGKMKDDPLRLYGIREGVKKMLSKASKAETPTVGNVEGQLLEISDVLDGIIEQGAPGYAKYRKNYHEASKTIDVMERLQEAKTQLTNGPDRVMTFGKFDRLMKDLIKERGDEGLTAAHHIPDDMMDRLFGIHQSLKRSASDMELAKTRGSDTSQMLNELGRQGIAQGIATIVPIPGANLAAPFITRHLGGFATRRRLERNLNPDRSRYAPPENDLGP